VRIKIYIYIYIFRGRPLTLRSRGIAFETFSYSVTRTVNLLRSHKFGGELVDIQKRGFLSRFAFGVHQINRLIKMTCANKHNEQCLMRNVTIIV
jgi:hypothetical protein